ncbi:DUF916 and DUF3324 domain-containing protein [Enterococcus sp. AZ179]|uniref:DUF916 and DUF3324 domain-containing protein n=1 Tax=Enterococcus sp. AZ179 TaxID=2774680 RepID=UPI003D297CC1
MNKLLKIFLAAVFTICGMIFMENQIVLADSNDFSISPVLPSNQREDNNSYFDLIVTPNENQTLAITIKNSSSETQKYNVIINTATTNQNGIVDYSITDFEKDDSMKISLKDIISLENAQIEVEANSQKDVSFELKVPEESFEGILLGGITVEPVVEEDSEGISNLITRTLAIVLTESDEVIEPELKAGEVSISQENYRNNVTIELRNITPTLIKRVTAEISISRSGNNEPIIEQTREQLSIAPNSKFNLMSQWDDQFEAGSYTYTIKLSGEEGHEWAFTKDFEIEAEQAKEFNTTSVDEKKNSINYYLVVGIGLFLLLLIICVYLVIKIRKMKNNTSM